MKRSDAGFTLLELLLATVILVSLVGLSLPLGRQAFIRQNLRTTTNTVTQAITDARARAKAGYEDQGWGVRVEDTVARVFAGNNYATRDSSLDRNFDLPGGMSVDTAGEALFTNQYAVPSGDLSYEFTSNDGETKTITINAYGAITIQ